MPSQLVYVKVQVLVPPQVGSALGTPAEGVIVFPQLSMTTGGVGAVASAGQSTVDEPPGGKLIVGVLIV